MYWELPTQKDVHSVVPSYQSAKIYIFDYLYITESKNSYFWGVVQIGQECILLPVTVYLVLLTYFCLTQNEHQKT